MTRHSDNRKLIAVVRGDVGHLALKSRRQIFANDVRERIPTKDPYVRRSASVTSEIVVKTEKQITAAVIGQSGKMSSNLCSLNIVRKIKPRFALDFEILTGVFHQVSDIKHHFCR